MSETPQERGRRFESEAAEVLGLNLVPGSGNRHADRSDAKGQIRLSCKSSTTKRSWAETRHQLAEAIEMAQGTGELPALAIEDMDGERLLILRLVDAGALLADPVSVQRIPRRAEVVRERSSVPVLLRDDG